IGDGSQEVIHYARREGWALSGAPLTANWRETVGRFRQFGGEYLAVYWDGEASPALQESYRPLFESLPVVDHRQGPWSHLHNRPYEYYILDLGHAADARHAYHSPQRTATIAISSDCRKSPACARTAASVEAAVSAAR